MLCCGPGTEPGSFFGAINFHLYRGNDNHAARTGTALNASSLLDGDRPALENSFRSTTHLGARHPAGFGRVAGARTRNVVAYSVDQRRRTESLVGRILPALACRLGCTVLVCPL